MIRLTFRSAAPAHDFVLLAYLMIGCFYVTDNFIYTTIESLLYIFVGSFLARPSAPRGQDHPPGETAGPDPLGSAPPCESSR
jgi:hypothetical protein